jgi:hypothetical protein
LVEIGGEYHEIVRNCSQNIGNTIWKPTKQRGPPHFPLDPDPPPEVLVDLITTLLTSKIPQVGSIVKEMRNMYGKSYYKAIDSMSGIRKKTGITALQDRIESQTKKNEGIK